MSLSPFPENRKSCSVLTPVKSDHHYRYRSRNRLIHEYDPASHTLPELVKQIRQSHIELADVIKQSSKFAPGEAYRCMMDNDCQHHRQDMLLVYWVRRKLHIKASILDI